MKYIVAAFAGAVILGGGTYYIYSRATAGPSGPVPGPGLTLTEDPNVAPGFPSALSSGANETSITGAYLPSRMPPAGFKDFRSTLYRFELFYPQDLNASDFDDGAGAHTFTFQNDTTAQGFQIFVVPYGARQVSAERFKEDEPSGVMDSPQSGMLDGVLATMFFGSNEVLGPTREIWFIKNGYLFEVTAPKQDDVWLQRIMATWQFI